MSHRPFRPLRLHRAGDREQSRHATWLELFFDLVFVFAIAELAHVLHSNLSWWGIASFAGLFIPVWWLWIDFSYYADQFDVEDGFYRLTMFGIMLGMVVMALTIEDVLHGHSERFAIIYTALRLVIIWLYIQAWRFLPEARELTARYTISFSIAFLFWLTSIAVPEPARFLLWAIALAIEISNGPITYVTIRSVPTQNSHMDERFGLFVIIVLGEAIVSVGTGVSQTDWQWAAILTGVSGFLMAVSLWWMYFERADETTINQALRGGRLALFRAYIYGYSHVLAFMGIVATSVGIQFAIEANSEHGFIAEQRTVLCGGIALFLIGVTLLQWASPCSLPRRVILARIGLALLTVGVLPLALSPLAIVIPLTSLLIALNAWDGVPITKA
ncbi:low temperature requirement a [Leptolyngbya sp. Heron Island J]|uniref:low temperature requirement protein A n=1 Tax=Leptolyngbya sp. Heron Island J TaxID=1385935 RepID=UPI0003B9D4EC|nr:low temperature requirement protein A [Leptolyngbya sp. Heron Island J]ESA38736.1 low temperature requirement a [Leptolyngbya sp. Heron Island J]